jgi:hypothetical protein
VQPHGEAPGKTGPSKLAGPGGTLT